MIIYTKTDTLPISLDKICFYTLKNFRIVPILLSQICSVFPELGQDGFFIFFYHFLNAEFSEFEFKKCFIFFKFFFIFLRFYMGVLDILNLIIFCMSDGILTMIGAVYCSSPIILYVKGGIICGTFFCLILV